VKKCYKELRRTGIILQTVKGCKANWIGYILRRNCLLKLLTEGKIERISDGK